jgi:hypothetical protein
MPERTRKGVILLAIVGRLWWFGERGGEEEGERGWRRVKRLV